jgi:hypothetical protein
MPLQILFLIKHETQFHSPLYVQLTVLFRACFCFLSVPLVYSYFPIMIFSFFSLSLVENVSALVPSSVPNHDRVPCSVPSYVPNHVSVPCSVPIYVPNHGSVPCSVPSYAPNRYCVLFLFQFLVSFLMLIMFLFTFLIIILFFAQFLVLSVALTKLRLRYTV